MNTKKKKKLPIKLMIVLIILAALAVAGVLGMAAASRSTHAAYVQSVMSLNSTYILQYSGDMTGTISDAATQNVYLTSDKVSAVNVTLGQTVEEGDVLFSYDTASLKDEIELANYKLAAQQDQLKLAQIKLQTVTDKPSWSEWDAKVRQWYMTKASSDQAEVSQQIASVEEQIAAETDPDKKAVLQAQLKTLQDTLTVYEYNTKQLEKDTEEHSTYEVHDENVRAAQLEVEKVQTTIRQTQNGINEIQNKINDSTVKAKMSGEISFLSDQMTVSNTRPFLTITSTNGLTVEGHLDEYSVKEAQVGDQISITSYMTGMSVPATIVSISPYADTGYNGAYYGQKLSFYQFQATITAENASGFQAGDSVGISMTSVDNAIVLDRIYVRTDEEGTYVLKDENGSLVRCPVETAATPQSNYLQITSGLEETDMITYPYGKSAVVGNATTTEQSVSLLSSLY